MNTVKTNTQFHELIRMAILAMVLSPAAWRLEAATPVMLIGPDLKPRLVNLQAIGGGRMTYFDDQRNMQVQSTNDVLQIRFPQENEATAAAAQGFIDPPEAPEAPAPPKPPALELTQPRTIVPDKGAPPLGGGRLVGGSPAAFVELISGQRIVAPFSGAKADGQTLLFKHDLLGELALALDQVSRLSFDGAISSGAAPTSDQVEMSNGDVVTGFVVAVNEKDIEVQQGDVKPFTLPRDRIKAIRLANPVSRAAGQASMVWLRDGGRLLASEVSISADKLTMICPLAGKAAVTIDLKHIARIELASPAGRLIDLADLPMSVAAGGKVFGLAMEPRIEGGAIHLHAPITVSFALPAKAVRLAALARLDAAGENTALAHFIVTITSAGGAAARHIISGQSPRAVINAPLAGRNLIINLDPADNGPVLDRLRLSDAVIFVER